MATEIIMPRVGISVESCIITQWHKNRGDAVKAGDILFSYETDKATAEEEAKEDGVLLEILAQEGEEVPVLQAVCVIGQPGEAWQAQPVNPEGGGKPPADFEEISNIATRAACAPPLQALLAESSDKISPRAKNLARKTGVDPRSLAGTGPGGRIIERDVRNAQRFGSQEPGIRDQVAGEATCLPSQDITQEAEIVKFSGIRKAIAKAMTQSLSTTAQLTNHGSFDASSILQYRAMLKQESDPALAGITLNDMLLYAVARTLKNHRDLNAHLIDDSMHYYNAVHLGIAVDTPRGLLVPTLFNAGGMSLAQLSLAAKQLIKDAQAGTISPDLLRGATFTVTNLGSLGVEMFTPVINPPQTGILGVCAIVDRPRQGTVYPAMGLSLTYDHRAVDGAPAARFIMELKQNLENFTALLAR